MPLSSTGVTFCCAPRKASHSGELESAHRHRHRLPEEHTCQRHGGNCHPKVNVLKYSSHNSMASSVNKLPRGKQGGTAVNGRHGQQKVTDTKGLYSQLWIRSGIVPGSGNTSEEHGRDSRWRGRAGDRQLRWNLSHCPRLSLSSAGMCRKCACIPSCFLSLFPFSFPSSVSFSHPSS